MESLTIQSRSQELEAIDRGLTPNSLWRYFTNPGDTKTAGLLEVSVIREGGRIGYTSYLPNGGKTPNLLRGLTVSRILELISSGYLVRV